MLLAPKKSGFYRYWILRAVVLIKIFFCLDYSRIIIYFSSWIDNFKTKVQPDPEYLWLKLLWTIFFVSHVLNPQAHFMAVLYHFSFIVVFFYAFI
jgi:hypothetical protein